MGMSTTGKAWTNEELYKLYQRRKDLYPDGCEYHKGGWYLTKGIKHDFEVGSAHVQALMLKRANELLGSAAQPMTDLESAVRELDRVKPTGQ